MGTDCGRRSPATTWIDSGWSTSKRYLSSRATRAPLPRRGVADLGGRTVAFLEGRRSAELADLIARHHGVPLAAPCVREVHTPDAPELQASIARVLDAQALDVAIFLTGVGTRTVFEAAQHMGRELELRERLD